MNRRAFIKTAGGVLLLGSAGCESTVEARIVVSSLMPASDVLTVFINSKRQEVLLHKDHPTNLYEVEVRAKERRSLITGQRFARVHVEAYSHEREQLSRKDTLTVTEDETEHVSISPFDFFRL